MNHGATVRKLILLKIELAAYAAHLGQTQDLDSAIRGATSSRGSSWVQVQRILSPDVVLRLDRSQSNIVYALLTELNPPVSIEVTPEAIDEWITKLGAPTPKGSLSEHAHALESAISRTLSGSELSKTQSAMQTVKRGLKLA